MNEDGEKWMYLDPHSNQQRGPIPESIVKRLIRKNLLLPEQHVWTKRLKEWKPLGTIDPFQTYIRTWSSFWFYMIDNQEQKGPVSTNDLVKLFLDGEIDGLTIVWSKHLTEWQPITAVPELKEFLHEANMEQEREEKALAKQDQVAMEDQVFEDESLKAFVAEDGKQYVFDSETKKWVTPQDKIQEDLDAIRETAGEEKQKKKTLPPPAPSLQLESNNEDKSNETETMTESVEPKRKRKNKKKKGEKWQKSKSNTWVYVNGLPLDITIQEIQQHFAKCGVLQTDLVTGIPRIKLYTNKDLGGLNGDASICYMKEASVDLAIQLLDKSQIRPEWTIDVSPAVFEQKGTEYVKSKKQRFDSRARVKRIEQEKALSWNEAEDGDRTGLRIVVIKHLFTPEEIEDDGYEQELQQDIEMECAKIGDVVKITLFSKHIDGVVVIKFASAGSAAKCVDIMNGRYFAGRKLDCHFWDGTDYTHRESKHEETERSIQFDAWLHDGSSSESEEEEEPCQEHPDRQVIEEETT